MVIISPPGRSMLISILIRQIALLAKEAINEVEKLVILNNDNAPISVV